MNAFLERLEAGHVLVADGATGTNLQERGLEPGAHVEDWLIDFPEKILALERDFVQAGAGIILTCTFGATSIRLEGSKYGGRVTELNRTAAAIAREAAEPSKALVGGSLGPLGKLLKPYGPLDHSQAVAAYAQQAGALSAAGVDLIVIETQFALEEAEAAFLGVRLESDLPVVLSFSYDRGTRTMMGVKPDAAAALAVNKGAAMIGVNCGTTLENAVTIIGQYASAVPSVPIWAKPNAGLPRLEGSRTAYDVTPAQMAEFARSAVEHGARAIGGCCGSTPEHVRAIAEAVAHANP